MSTEHFDVIVIGGGPAGITFSKNLKNLNAKLSVAMFRPEEYSMIYCAIPYAIEGLFDYQRTFKSDNLVTDSDTKLIKQSVKSVDLSKKIVVDSSGKTYSANVIFIATGANPVLPPIPGSDAKNVYTVKNQVDMENIMSKLEGAAKRAIVVGAGAIGIEQAQAYLAKGLEVFLVDLAPRVLPNMIDSEIAEILHDEIRDKGIHLILSVSAKSIEKSGDMASRLMLSNGEFIDINPETDFICFSVGMKPDIDIFSEQGLKIEKDGIVVDSKMRTNINGVYAAGDCCHFTSAIDGKSIMGKLATSAVPMAKTAARVVAGLDDAYDGFINGAATCVFDYRVGSTGFTEDVTRLRGFDTIIGWGETTTLFPMMPGAKKLRVKIVADNIDMRVIGGQVLSVLPTTDKIDIISLAIAHKLTVKDLSKLSYSAQPWQSFMPARNAIVQACESIIQRI